MSSPLARLAGQGQPPTDPGWIKRAMRNTDAAVREIAARASDLTGAVIRGGLLRIVERGGLVVEGAAYTGSGVPTGATFAQFTWGALPDDPKYNHPGGDRQMGWLAYRDDGTLAMAIAELRADDGQYAQAVLWFDRAGNVIVSEDTNSGRGLARPHLGQFAGAGDTNVARWPSTTASGWTGVWGAFWEIQNPRLSWNTQLYVPAGATGQFRLKYGDTVLGTSDPLTGGSTGQFGQWFGSRVLLPGAPGDELWLSIEAAVTAGTGEVRVNPVQMKGDQS